MDTKDKALRLHRIAMVIFALTTIAFGILAVIGWCEAYGGEPLRAAQKAEKEAGMRLEECRQGQFAMSETLTKYAAGHRTECQEPQVCPPAPECPACAACTLTGRVKEAFDACWPGVLQAKAQADQLALEFTAALEAAKAAGWNRNSSWWLTTESGVDAYLKLEAAEGAYHDAFHDFVFEHADACQGAMFNAMRETDEYKQLNALMDYGPYNTVLDPMRDLGPSWWQKDALECSTYCSGTGQCRIRHVPGAAP